MCSLCIKPQNCQLSTCLEAELLRSLSSVSIAQFRSSSCHIQSMCIISVSSLPSCPDPSHPRPQLSEWNWRIQDLVSSAEGDGGVLVAKREGCLLPTHWETCFKNFLMSVIATVQKRIWGKTKKECFLECYKHSKKWSKKSRIVLLKLIYNTAC